MPGLCMYVTQITGYQIQFSLFERLKAAQGLRQRFFTLPIGMILKKENKILEVLDTEPGIFCMQTRCSSTKIQPASTDYTE